MDKLSLILKMPDGPEQKKALSDLREQIKKDNNG